MFFFATADSGLAAEEAARDKARAASGAAVPTGAFGGWQGRESALAEVLLTRGQAVHVWHKAACKPALPAFSFLQPCRRTAPPHHVPRPPAGQGGDEGGERAAALHQHLLVEFALSLLQGALKKGIINPRGPGAGGGRAAAGRSSVGEGAGVCAGSLPGHRPCRTGGHCSTGPSHELLDANKRSASLPA